jgi:hypothetical protein
VVVLLTFIRLARLERLPLTALISISAFCFCTTLIGIGLLSLRKWAAILFSLALVAVPILNTVDTVREGPLAWNLIVFVCSVVFIAPIVIIIRSWSLLSWRGKWLL